MPVSDFLIHPAISPIAFEIGPLAVRWYGLMYLLAFVGFMLLGRLHARRLAVKGVPSLDVKQIDDLLFWGVLGVVLGGRLGYVLFYKPAYYLENWHEIPAIWTGGMSFHGGFLGVLVAAALFARRIDWRFFQLTDFIAPLVPLGLAAGRMGNFINAELVGRVTDVPWAMIFPTVDAQPRHPSQLYQFALEGLALFALLWWFSRVPRPCSAVSALFLIGYGGFRFIAEFGREPDDFLGLLAGGLSMGQWLSLPMIAAGVVMMILAYRRN